MQLFVRCFGGCTAALQLEPDASVASLKQAIEDREGVPVAEQLLTYAGRVLHCGSQSLAAAGLGADATLTLCLRLAGGKGGFGALLRGQGRDGKITDNFDACRDLSGRRVRQVEAEKKLAEWQAEAKERELEKIALQHMKEMAREQKRQRDHEINVEAVKREQREAAARVADAVQSALAEGLAANSGGNKGSSSASGEGGSNSSGDEGAAAGAGAGPSNGASPEAEAGAAVCGKRKGAAEAARGGAPKRAKAPPPKMLAMLEGSGDDDDSDDSEDDS